MTTTPKDLAEAPATFTPFDFLLNAFEQASQAEKPAEHRYGEKRRALYAHVRDLEAQSAKLDALKAENEALRKDAERYRWLRSDEIGVPAGQREIVVYLERLPFCEDQSDEMLIEQALDDAIDAAMAQKGG